MPVTNYVHRKPVLPPIRNRTPTVSLSRNFESVTEKVALGMAGVHPQNRVDRQAIGARGHSARAELLDGRDPSPPLPWASKAYFSDADDNCR